jgi:hypothetical protein
MENEAKKKEQKKKKKKKQREIGISPIGMYDAAILTFKNRASYI